MAKAYKADVVVVGGGLAGIATALELLSSGQSVVLIDRAPRERFGGLAKRSFGGIFAVDSPEQRRGGIKDTVDLALADWRAYAEFEEGDVWPDRWAQAYVNRCRRDVRDWLCEQGLSFFPAVHWAERGLFTPGNSVPRFHLVWGTGQGLVKTLVGRLEGHANASKLELHFEHLVDELITEGGRVVGCSGTCGEETFEARGGATVIAAGGIAGNLELVRKHWYAKWGEPPESILNGSHPDADGKMLDVVRGHGGKVTHLDRTWHYAAGVRHWKPLFEGHGLSIVPPKSALWLDWKGRRIGPAPLVGNFDTRYLMERVCLQEKKYSWQILNMKIARREFAVSGSEFNAAVRDKKIFKFIRKILFGDATVIQQFIDHCPDVLVAGSVKELADAMNGLTQTDAVDPELLASEIDRYDQNVARGKLSNDDQLRRIAHARLYKGDRLRTCKSAQINDPRSRPLIAIHERVVTRKSLGGLQTNLEGQVLGEDGEPLAGLYAVGESAGFGGGGVHGLRSLEGTFLGGCVLTGRVAAQALVSGKTAES